jgi:hypothetical protein
LFAACGEQEEEEERGRGEKTRGSSGDGTRASLLSPNVSPRGRQKKVHGGMGKVPYS